MNNIKILIIFLIICAIPFCTNKENKENKEKENTIKSIVNNCLGRKLMIPDSLVIYSPFSNYTMDSIEISNAHFKIYSYINASCPTCIEDILLWNNITPCFVKYNIPIILICESKDNFELIKYFHEQGMIKKFSFPLFFDVKGRYLAENKFMEESPQLETVLTDRENNILLLGNPIRSKEIKDLYLSEILKRMNSTQVLK